MTEGKRAFKGIWIPSEIWLSKDLTVMEKLFLVEIDSLDNEEGCYASNEYFSKFFDLSKNRCTEIIKSLCNKGYLTIQYEYGENTKNITKRILRVTDNFLGIRKTEHPIRKTEGGIRKTEEGYSEKCEDNNTGFNNTLNITTTNKEVVDKIKSYFDLDEETIKKVANVHLATGKDISYLIEKLELVKSKPDIRDIVGYLISALKNDYKNSINQPKCFIPSVVNTRFHLNCNQNFNKYTAEELEQMLFKSQEGKFN